MANNRLYIHNTETGETLMIAKSFSDGWELRCTKKAIQSFLQRDDWKSSCSGGPSNFVLATEADLPDGAEMVKQ